MRITSAEFVSSAIRPDHYPAAVGPEIAFVGRSNVGKSSVINTLLQRPGLAKISGTPGKTRLINFFCVNDVLGFIDLPGYGFARVSRQERAAWGPMVEQLFRVRQALAGVVHILDVRHQPSADDQRMRVWLLPWSLPLLVVATKADKLGRTKRPSHLQQITEVLDLGQACQPLLFSARTGEGREQIWKWICQVTGL